MPDLKVVSEYQPAGDQPQAIDKLARGLENGLRAQVLKGVTGSGKTYTMAKVIERVNRPTLVLAHNKTLAAQLCEEFREFFPNNAVEYFVSYYDYYQPEAYVPQTNCCGGWWRTATSATTWPSSAMCSGYGATRWSCTPPTIRTGPSVWSSSVTRSSVSRSSIRSLARP